MIVVVDDDDSVTAFLAETLTGAGHEVRAFHDARDALAAMADAEPDLIVSDVVMPMMTGFDFKRAYADQFPHRLTPFVFLSSLSDPANIVHGLDLGADDFLNKPVAAEVLRAKVRSLLARKQRYMVPVFRGDLARYPFIKLLQFCEQQGLTGDVEIDADALKARIPFRAGQIAPGEAGADDDVAKAVDLVQGTFTVRSAPVDFSGLADAAVRTTRPPAAAPASTSVMGRLSGVKANNRLFQVQTEFRGQPEPVVVTVVILDGRTVLKRVSPPLPGRTREEWERAIQEQHAAVEGEVESKVQALQEKGATVEPRRKTAASLVEEGLARYLEKDYAGALVHWEEAHKMDPDNKSLAVNLQVARKKVAEKG